MLQKKIFKILSVLVAVIIAFSCFILPCSAVSFGEDFIINYYSLFYSVYDDNGEYVETIYPESDSVIVTFDENKICFDISSVPSVSNGYYFIDIDFDFEYSVSSDSSEAIIFYYSQGLGPDLTGGCYYEYEDLNGNFKSSYFQPYLDYNALGFICTPSALSFSCDLNFLSNSETNNLSFVFEVASDVDSIEEYLSSNSSDSGSSPAPDEPISSFLSDIGVFFGSCISWVKDILNFTVSNPSLFILLIGFFVCVFVFGVLSRFKRG